MKMGTVIDDISAADSLRRGIQADRLGFDSIWFSDHLIDTGGIKVDPWTTMGALAATTNKVVMCAAVSDFQRIHPAKMAHMAATLDGLSNGRCWLGIGAGEAMNLVPFGISFAGPRERAEQLGEAVQVIKLLWRSSGQRPVSFQGKHFCLKDAWLDVEVSRTPRVIVGALGGRSALEAAGRYGDGWVSWLNSPDTFRGKLEIAKSAGREQGRNDLGDFEACVWIYTVLTSDQSQIRKAMDRAKRGLLAEAHTLKMMGFNRPRKLGETFQNMVVVSGESDKSFAAAQNSVPDELALSCIAAGTSSQVIEKIQDFNEAGATTALIHFVGDGEDQLEEFASKVLSHFTS